ncbi:MAG TPA: tetratricopeptide repeat protein [Ignavibacteriales bacterium]|nr:tetratricopeptide repeat protein [Ignavibacteriales bacterium]
MKIIITILLLFISNAAFSQSDIDKQKAHSTALKAVKIMDQGDLETAITMLNESCKLDPEKPDYRFELGYAYYLKKDFGKSIETLKQTLTMKDISDQYYQMLGNILDESGKRDSALGIYQKGLEKFPNSGRLYLEMGSMQKDSLQKALEYYEKGIQADPGFPSNYYRAAKLFCASTERVWGVLYGEIFMNMERGSDRTEEISKLLFDTYSAGIKFESDSTIQISFSKNGSATMKDDGSAGRLPFGLGVFEPLIAMSITGEKGISLESLSRIRTNFVKRYFAENYNQNYKNVLYDWHKALIDNGYFDSYNHWLLMAGASDEFDIWQEANKEKFGEFINWFKSHQLKIDKDHKFHRVDYLL